MPEEQKYSQQDLIWIQNNVCWLDYDKTHHPDSFRWTLQAKWLVNCDKSLILLAWGNQDGKASPVDTPVLTPTGWVKIGKLSINDRIISGDGDVSKVTGVFQRGELDCYKFIFDDGSSVEVAEDHLWKIKTPSRRFKKTTGVGNSSRVYDSWDVVSTKTIIDNWGVNPINPKQRLAIPVVNPVMLDSRPVPIEPYLLGLLLGDGAMSGIGSINFTTVDTELIDALGENKHYGKYRYNLTGLKNPLRELGLLGKHSWDKFIPEQYLWNDVSTRLAILQGLMDTDGSIYRNCLMEYSTTSKQLASDVVFLVQSLGGKAEIKERKTSYKYNQEKKIGRLSYRVMIKIQSVNPFRLKRKADRFYIISRTSTRILYKIEPVGKKESVCISIAHNSGTYVTNDFIVTHNSDTCAEDWALRIQGLHPVSWKNLKPTDKIRTFRVCAETLPTEKGDDEQKNTIYKAIMRRFPRYLLKKDITIRNPVQQWRCPQGGPDFYVEYVSYGQTDQRQAGVQRKAVLIDEGAGNEFFIEQTRRITAAESESGGADIIIAYTPTETEAAWMFDDILERAKVIYRTPTVLRRIYKRSGGQEKLPLVEVTDNDTDIAVIFSSLLDNPVFPMDVKIKKIKELSDPDVQDARGFGLFRQISGKVYKNFNSAIHVVDLDRYFANGLPDNYKFARGIDYHSKNPWACVFIAVSSWDEIFVWDEYEAFPDKMQTYDFAKILAIKSKMYKYTVSKIDPLATNKQSNTGLSPVEDLNRYFHEFYKDNICTGGYWTSWDTKSSKGLDEFRKRLQNSVICGKPFNNEQVVSGRRARLPTIWFSNQCVRTIEGVKKWKWQDWKDRDRLTENDPKGDKLTERQQKYSHFPITIECLLKCPEVVMARFKNEFTHTKPEQHPRYFQAGGR